METLQTAKVIANLAMKTHTSVLGFFVYDYITDPFIYFIFFLFYNKGMHP